MALATSPDHCTPLPLPGTHLRSRACSRAPLAGLSRGSGASNKSRRESLRAANTRCQPRRTPEGRGTWGKAGMGGPTRLSLLPPCWPPPPRPAPAHRQEALVGRACARFRVYSQGCAEVVRGHRAGRGLGGTRGVTEVATGCGESRRRRWCEAGWGQLGTRSLGGPSPGSPEAVVAPELSPIPPSSEEKKRASEMEQREMRHGPRGKSGCHQGQAVSFPLPRDERWACRWSGGLTVTAQALAAQAQHQRGAAETLGRGWEAPGPQRVGARLGRWDTPITHTGLWPTGALRPTPEATLRCQVGPGNEPTAM